MDTIRVKIVADISAVVEGKQRDFKAGEEVTLPTDVGTAMHRRKFAKMIDGAGLQAAAELPARKK